jgi:hypothetical protein
MRFETVSLAPALARELLDKADASDRPKRTIRRTKVKRFGHAMESGQWTVTHQPIAVGFDGLLLDGFHRCTAVVETGVTVDQTFAWDADPATFGVIDTGTARTTADSLKVAGFTDTNVLAASVRSFLTYQEIAGTTDEWRLVHADVTTDDVLHYLDSEDGSKVVESSMQAGRIVASGLRVYGSRTPLTTVAMILKTRRSAIGPDAQSEFYARLGDGALLPSHSPILALRKWYAGAGTNEGVGRVPNRERMPTTIAVTIKAINDYRAGHERSAIRWYLGRNPMPEPLSRKELNAIERDREARLEEIERRDGSAE